MFIFPFSHFCVTPSSQQRSGGRTKNGQNKIEISGKLEEGANHPVKMGI
jgi:hypothetical protein